MRIGFYTFCKPLILAPMTGVTNWPLRRLYKRLGKDLAVLEIVTANPQIRDSEKTWRQIDHAGEAEPRIVQIAGSEPGMMAEAAHFRVNQSAPSSIPLRELLSGLSAA